MIDSQQLRDSVLQLMNKSAMYARQRGDGDGGEDPDPAGDGPDNETSERPRKRRCDLGQDVL